jgi:urea ABC transporter ATP-binding protein UrtE
MTQNVLSLERVEAGYGGGPVVRGVDLRIEAGECVAILGRNGMGKSTLLRTVVGLVPRSSGTIRYGNHLISEMQTHEIARSGIAYVPQGRGIFPSLTVEENLKIGTRASGRGVSIPSQIFDYFPSLSASASKLGGALSGGQQQMLAIARAMCGRPTTMLLDEPSEGIQPNLVRELGRILPLISREHGMSLLIVEQNLNLALHVGQRVLILDKGAIVYQAKREELDRVAIRNYLTV